MRPQKQMWSVFALLSGFSHSLVGQVEKAVITTTGISCGVCAVVTEVQFRRLQEVDRVSISLPKETITLSYKTGAKFRPRQVREVLQKVNVGIVRFQINARGRVQEDDGKRFFVGGNSKFVLARDPSTIPADTKLIIEGIVNDDVDPPELRIVTFRRLTQ